MEAIIKQLTSKEAMNLIKQVESAFKSLPHLPAGIVEFLVKIAPWLAGIGGVFGVLGGLSALSAGLGLGMYTQFMRYAGYSSVYFLVSGIAELIMAGLLLMAFKYLKAKQLTGWVLIFWSSVVSLVMSLLGIVLVGGFAIGSIIGALIGFYILFEMKPSYKSGVKAETAE